MLKTLFERYFRWFIQRRRTIGIMLVLCTALAAMGLFAVPFEGLLETMLPERSEALRTISFLRDSNLGDKVAVNVKIDPEKVGKHTALAELDRLAEEFERSDMIEQAVRFPGGGEMMEHVMFFLDHSGELLREDDIEALHEKIGQDEINELMRRWYGRLARPEGSFMMQILRRDPFDISSVILARMETLSASFGYHANIENGHLFHPDGHHAMLLLETNVPVTDTVGSRNLIDFSKDSVAQLPEGLTADLIAGHQHSVSNEDVLRRDIHRTLTIASVGFLVLFVGIFRDIRAIILFVLPAVSVIFAINLSALLLGRLSYLVIGFGAVLAGIAVDYGIQVYVSMRHNSDPYRAVKNIVKPLVLGALTTLSVFVAFLASDIPGYRQLGVFAVISISMSVFAAIFFLPALLKTDKQVLKEVKTGNKLLSDKSMVIFAIFFLFSLFVCGFFTRNLQVNTSVTQLDGTEQRILNAEEKFQQLWTRDGTGQAIAVVTGKSYKEVSEKNDGIYSALRSEGMDRFSNLAMLWPAETIRRRNLERWNEFWSRERVTRTQEYLREAAREHGFSEDTFEPFWNTVANQESISPRPVDNPIFSSLEDRFVHHHQGEYRFMTFFPDTAEAGRSVSRITENVPGVFIASPSALGESLSEAISSEVKYISAIAMILILFIVLVLTGSIRMSIAALAPATVGVLWLFAIMAVTGLSLDIANMIAGIVVVGLCIDYGIFMVHGWTRGQSVMLPIRRAIILSAISTLTGAGALIFAQHPALLSIGLTLVIGIAAGFMAAMLAVPGMCMLLHIKREEVESI